MGNKPSTPKPGTPFRVIGAGLPRTGTASLSAALSILLEGPIYHGGTQVTLGPPSHIRAWGAALRSWPDDQALIRKTIHDCLDGYAGTTDCPGMLLVPELLAAYPDAVVVCGVRDASAWARSLNAVASTATMRFLGCVLLPLPTMRHFIPYADALRPLFVRLFGEREPFTPATYHRHQAWLREVVPPEKLFFVDVRDGWEPLCKALGKDVPVGVDFPRINDAEATERLAKEFVTAGLVRWAVGLGALGAAVGAYWLMRS